MHTTRQNNKLDHENYAYLYKIWQVSLVFQQVLEQINFSIAPNAVSSSGVIY